MQLITISKPGHPSWMPLAGANHNIQPNHPSRMLLAIANHNIQTQMPLVEANQNTQ